MTTAVPPDLYDLAPRNLPRPRSERFDAAGFGLPLAAFAPADRDTLRELYAVVKRLADRWRDSLDRPDWDVLRGAVLALDPPQLMAAARGLGAAVPPTDPRGPKLLHDIRGGGLAALLGTAELLALGEEGTDLVRSCYAAARDHAKIMRSGLPELDPATYAADEAARVHGIDAVVSGWDGRVVNQPGGPVEVRVRCAYSGPITARCLETAALDRVVYNLTNNAARFAADGRVTVWAFPVADGLVRWVVENAVRPDDRAWLDRETGGDYGVLFAGGRTRGGTGIGLANCAEIAAAAFGLDEPAAAVAGGYVGAAGGAAYRAWFHWPVPAGGGPACGCG